MRVPSLLTLLLFLSPVIEAAVLAIDYGAEFTKLSLIKPGVPFDVVLDRDSKRKIQSVVGWKREDRVFGQEGKMAASRFPETHFPYVKPLLGASRLPPLDIFPNPPSLSLDGTLTFPHPSFPSHLSPAPSTSEQVWTPTSLLAHQISYYRTLAESLTPTGQPIEPINQVIVTVPSWWNTYQRKSYRDALELQGLTCLAMIGEGTGVALNYAMTRTFPTYNQTNSTGEKEYHLIYDSGALQTTATVVAFYQTEYLPTPKSKTPVVTTHIEVLGVGWEEMGGVMLDLAIQAVLLEDFVQKSGKEGVRDDKRALAKLAKEANRVKHILSANLESNVAIESLYDDIDYRSRFSRVDFESLLTPSEPLFASPITSALSTSTIPLSNLTSIILFGGNTRVPFVQSAIKSVLGEEGSEKLAQNVNTDEAAVLGAAYWGAALSRQFKMKKIEVVEKAIEEFRVSGDVLFEQGVRLGERKTLGLAAQDVTLGFSQGSKPVLSVEILDIETALANFTSPSPIVNLTMRLDSRGHLATINAVLVSNVTETSTGGVAGAIKGFFGKKDKAEDVEAEADASDVPEVPVKGEKIALKFRERHLGVRPMSGEEKRTTMARLASVATFESAKHSREEARNVLEGYLYRLSNLLSPDSDNKALMEYSTEEERAKLSDLVTITFEWLGENAEKADEKTLRAKRIDLLTIEEPIIIRFTESRTRGKAIDDFQKAMFSARAFFVEAHKNATIALESAFSATPDDEPVAPPRFSKEELGVVGDLLKDNEGWMDGLMKIQVGLEGEKWRDPVIFTKDLDERGRVLQSRVLKLMGKKQPKAPRPSKSTSTSSSPSASASTSQTESSSTVTGTSEPAAEVTTPPSHEEL